MIISLLGTLQASHCGKFKTCRFLHYQECAIARVSKKLEKRGFLVGTVRAVAYSFTPFTKSEYSGICF